MENTETEFGSFDQPETSTVKEGFKNWKLKQPDFSKNETSTTFVCRIVGALDSYKNKKAWFLDDLTGKFVSVNWAFYHAKHCGYKATSKEDPSRVDYKAFVCPRKVKNKVEVVPCAACAKAWKYKELLKAMRDAAGKDPAAIADMEASDRYREMTGYLDNLWTDNKWKVLAMNRDGEVGVLHLSKTTFQNVLYPLITKNPKGDYWIKFTSQGNNRNKTDSAEILKETKEIVVDGNTMTVEVKVPATWTAEQKAKILELAPDISKPLGAFYLSQDKINQLVESSGDPDEVARIFDGASTEELVQEPVSLTAQLS